MDRERAIFGTTKMWRWLILVLLSPVAWGMGDYAATIHNSEWTHSGSNTLCTLAHEITGYGVGRFELRPGRRLAFVVETLQPLTAMESEAKAVSPR
ncbi:MAG: hypothetical protein B0D96_11600 [Candidatus Sedimenticola endophacoides]|uniref:MotY N-terminal domain-containing protein n=1 Tax=Candidatus Sedimenticola endophacoides TaxID=2548426 RepID=A0A6N4DPU3_9GAMM|nr:MAG: hypothetical protein B0D96_11600 [Candidatus Sedimenticola endophacoides]OQX39710.1 MAG: hypothetical protein B0D89_10080 [Candidatus Sedimenticola endophacoides]PUD99027.1 MAG: hypothetical protein C3L24_11645 [Candidatus Sedimenticola endophacoides]PUE02340.1 MAG: hypothetical protein C3L26_01595 [Candidatus Sedimenticola endophacoides]PUE05201.1 MAG: hypothetical protein C3L25_01590 [Candidatus Sedimenticola endophacoides]